MRLHTTRPKPASSLSIPRSGLFASWLVKCLAMGLGLLGPWAVASEASEAYDRVGRLTDLRGEVSFYDPDRNEWSDALHNRPVVAGDRVVLGPDARAEVRVAGAVLLLGQGADVEWLDMDARQLRLRVRDGTLLLRLPTRRLAEQTEILTDETRLRPLRGGDYRIDRDGASTFAASLRGGLEASGGGNLLMIETGQRFEVWVDSRRDVARSRPAPLVQDRLSAWADSVWRDDERDAPYYAQPSPYLHDDLPGAEDLARHGRWDRHPEYGALWFPVGIGVGWQPFRDGRWVWMRPWGWTWVDAAPWGFATSHYGRWVQWRGRWGWWPGPRHVRPSFSPAVVAWVGGSNVSFSVRIGDIPPPAWAPLAPWQPYVPIVVQRPHPPKHRPAPPHRRLPPPSDPISGSPSVTYGKQGVPVGVHTMPSARQLAPSAPLTSASPPSPAGPIFRAAPAAPAAPVSRPRPPMATPQAPVAEQPGRPSSRDQRDQRGERDGRGQPDQSSERRPPPSPLTRAPLPATKAPFVAAPATVPAPAQPARKQTQPAPRQHDAVN